VFTSPAILMDAIALSPRRSAQGPPTLSDLDRAALEQLFLERGLPAFRGRQVYQALWTHGVQSVVDISTLPAQLRAEMAAEFRARTLDVQLHLTSKIDGAEKVLFRLHDGLTVESVLIPSRNRGRRFTVCVSSQVGCPAACSFCATGLGGFSRNLSAAEIADQVLFFVPRLRQQGNHVTNVVFMGMGEPLLNVAGVRGAIERLTEPQGFGMGDRRITVSSVGIVPQLRTFHEWANQVNLAISLHAPNDALRTDLVPYNIHFPIHDILEAVRDYTDLTHRRVSFEYVLLRGVNDNAALAADLARLLRPLGGMAHVNLIPWNPFREGRFVRADGPDADAFAQTVRQGGVGATIRYSKGLDISAACGQLRETLTTADLL
jgi:23S rRNA (adenine2503-C2)-methyltransferase